MMSMWEYDSDYKTRYFCDKVSCITNNFVFVVVHSFLQLYDKAVLLQWWQGGHEIIKGSGSSCVADTQNPWQILLYKKFNFLMCISGFFLERQHKDSSFQQHLHHDESQGLSSTVKHPSARGGQWNTLKPQVIKHCPLRGMVGFGDYQSHAPLFWGMWAELRSVRPGNKVIMEQIGSKCWVSGRSCTEGPWLGMKDRAQLRSLLWALQGHSYSNLQYCHTPSLSMQVSAHSSPHSRKTSPHFAISKNARLNFSCHCTMGISLLLIWGRQAVWCSIGASRATPLRFLSAFLCCCKTWPNNVHIWARATAGAASEWWWLTGDEMLGVNSCFRCSLF